MYIVYDVRKKVSIVWIYLRFQNISIYISIKLIVIKNKKYIFPNVLNIVMKLCIKCVLTKRLKISIKPASAN